MRSGERLERREGRRKHINSYVNSNVPAKLYVNSNLRMILNELQFGTQSRKTDFSKMSAKNRNRRKLENLLGPGVLGFELFER